MTPIFYIQQGNLSFADKKILSDIELYISHTDRICLIGKNGSGKSSLVKVISGEYELDTGKLFKNPITSISYLKQDIKSIPDCNIYEYVLSNFKNHESNKYHADMILDQLGINGDIKLKNCSGGQIKKICLAKSLISKSDILLLDEPTNHLDIKTIEWLEDYIKNYPGAVVCISHDRKFQENVTNKIWWIDRATLRKSDKGFKYYDKWQKEVIEQEEAEIYKMNRKLDAEKDWLNTGVTARRKRNQKRLANLYNLRESLRLHQSHLKKAKSKLQIELSDDLKKTKFILEAKNISYNYPDKKVINNFTIKIKKGEKIGIIGPNGSGKSTLIKLFVKDIDPFIGTVKHGVNIDITYFDQHRTELNPNHTLKQTLCPSGGDQVFIKDKYMHVAGYLKKFLFDPKIIDNKVSTLSGGEANRLLLSKSLITPGNFLILDEPTNDLDMDSLEMLLEILADYTGTLVVVSHDRDFLERLVTRTIVFTENELIDLYGGYEDYLKYYSKKSKVISANKKTDKTKIERKNTSKKLSYKYVRLLEILPKEIEKLEKDIQSIERELSKTDLYKSDPEKFNSLTHSLEDMRTILDSKLEKWIEIENMNESYNSNSK